MNRTIITIILLAVIAVAFFALRKTSTMNSAPNANTAANQINQNGQQLPATGSNNPASSTTEKTSAKIVVYSNGGFSPKTIFIKLGDKVTFENKSSGKMWVASNPHPTHTDYPAFDEKASVQTGGSWSFVFDQTGTWGYHNHDKPSNTGSVVVQ